MDDFWRVLWDVGRLTPEDLATMDHPIEACPCHLPHMIPGFEHYLWILKRTHCRFHYCPIGALKELVFVILNMSLPAEITFALLLWLYLLFDVERERFNFRSTVD